MSGALTDLRARLSALRGALPAPAPAPATVAPRLIRDPLRIERRRHALSSRHGRRELSWLLEALSRARAHEAWQQHAEAMVRDASLLDALPHGALFLDTETSGLSGGAGTLAWLVGLAWIERGPDPALVVEQLVLGEIRGECELLDRLRSRLERAEVVVTFNGKSFDLPLLGTRYVLQRVQAPPARAHLDLLHPSRRVFAHAVGDSRLTSLERHVLGFEREDDIASEDVPQAWFDYLRTGRTDEIDRVVRHNEWDLLSLVGLSAALLELATPGAAPDVLELPGDSLELARQRLRAGDREAAMSWLSACGAADAGQPERQLAHARATKRIAGPAAAIPAWRALVERGCDSVEPYEELAKVLEHRLRDAATARRYVLDALDCFGADARISRRLRHRLLRLERKLRPTLEEAACRETSK